MSAASVASKVSYLSYWSWQDSLAELLLCCCCAIMQPMWGELFSLFPVLVGRIPLATFFTIVPLLKPRYYRCAGRQVTSARHTAPQAPDTHFKSQSQSVSARVLNQNTPHVMASSQAARFRSLLVTQPVLQSAPGKGRRPAATGGHVNEDSMWWHS